MAASLYLDVYKRLRKRNLGNEPIREDRGATELTKYWVILSQVTLHTAAALHTAHSTFQTANCTLHPKHCTQNTVH